MRLLLDILQGAGLAGAAGIRPFLAALLAGALARGDLGLDFEHTSYSFLESPGFLLGVVVALVVVVVLQRREPDAVLSGAVGAAVAGLGIGLGALLFAGSLADHGYAAWPGLVGGLACAALASAATRALLERTRKRLDRAAAAALPVYADAASLVVAGAAIAFPPLSLVALGFLTWLLVGSRRRASVKHEGLRTLR